MPATFPSSRLLTAGAVLLLAACQRQPTPPPATAGKGATPSPAAATPGTHCLADRSGLLSARLRGALDAKLDWRDAELECTGGARPDGSGIRVSIAGPLDASGQRLRLVFGLAAKPGTARAANVPTNLTVIQEGAQRLFSTRGDDKCQSELLTQQPEDAAHPQVLRVTARGYCIGAAATLDGRQQLWLERFDFSARIDTEEKDTL